MKIVVASKNPVKIQASKKAFEAVFKTEVELITLDVASGVSEQPKTDKESLQGALNRAKAAREQIKDADYYIGLEAGIEDSSEGMMSFSWQVILSQEKISKIKTQTIFLPESLADLIRQGYELGHAIDKVFKQQNSKQKQGAVGVMTEGLVTRERLYYDAIVLGLIPFNIMEKTKKQFD